MHDILKALKRLFNWPEASIDPPVDPVIGPIL